MDWDECLSEAKEEFGYDEQQFIPRQIFEEIIFRAKEIQEEDYQDNYEINSFYGKQIHKKHIQSDYWKKLRMKILFRDNFECKKCNNKATEVHHLTYNNLLTELEIDDCISICRDCHKKIHHIK